MSDVEIRADAQVLAEARIQGRALSNFPGAVPVSLDEAYAWQSAAIDLWGDRIVGWKVGRVMGEAEGRYGTNRFIGPIFARTLSPAPADGSSSYACIAGGSAAMEAEIVAVVDHDLGEAAATCSPEQARRAVKRLHIGIELAGSPVAGIDRLGPLASIAAFGNNAGLVLGPPVPDWRERADGQIMVTSEIDGEPLGSASAAVLPGGVWAAAAFAIAQAARLGRPLQAGALISTGAITGVHPVVPGQYYLASFHGLGSLGCSIDLRGQGSAVP